MNVLQQFFQANFLVFNILFLCLFYILKLKYLFKIHLINSNLNLKGGYYGN